MAKYREIADALRKRILAGEFAIGDQFPTIAALQAAYGVRSMNTIRTAQHVLITEGLLATYPGRGTFVISTTPLETARALEALTRIRNELTTVITTLGARPHWLAVTPDEFWVLITALENFMTTARTTAFSSQRIGDVNGAEINRQRADMAAGLITRAERIRDLL
ncbi:GntR family transcriptional regulator [Jiangella aurantiaca]|uniref:GntR family transcriptional regulator n=1 Tax=Jiangella aurantiaca TaxID=2530373 RepID=A0A4V2YR65_9ACTN|nr:GntR family transcriptional regulator [Jiangella aurantiaca]TDD64777.1 GntR family transcriptional regulator [Jiangella aurantiaca]